MILDRILLYIFKNYFYMTFDIVFISNVIFVIYILHFTFYVLHFTFYILRFTFYILHFTFYVCISKTKHQMTILLVLSSNNFEQHSFHWDDLPVL